MNWPRSAGAKKWGDCIRLFVKRDDLLPPKGPGSKWRKLFALLPAIEAAQPRGLLTFGGAFSNHLQAVAVVGRLWKIPTAGIVRGQHVDLNNPTLRNCRAHGMTLVPVPKAEYDALKRTNGPMPAQFADYFMIPEGGNTPESLRACRSIADEVWDEVGCDANEPLHLCVPAGTGCTVAGVASGLLERPNARLWAFPASSGGPDETELYRLLANANINPALLEGRVRVLNKYLAGGFARFNPDVLAFAKDFEQRHGILLDPVYTAKMAWGVQDLLGKGHFPNGSTVVMLHTGGLQGWRGFRERFSL